MSIGEKICFIKAKNYLIGCSYCEEFFIISSQNLYLMKQLFFSIFIFLSFQLLNAQQKELPISRSYVIGFAEVAPKIDGDIDQAVWQKAKWTDDFTDIEGDTHNIPYFQTKAKMVWDNSYLYIAAKLDEEHIWGYLTGHDDIVFHDNDFEVFIDPSNSASQYFEIEINARNTTFDLFLPKPYRAGGNALFAWGSDRIKHAVKINGSLNNPRDKDKYWTVEIAIPWSEMSLGNNVHIPKEGEIWRLNFSRVEWETDFNDSEYIKKKDKSGNTNSEHNWVWSPQGEINMHLPERWGYVQFTKKSGEDVPLFELPYKEKQRKILWKYYYAQNAYYKRNKSYSSNLAEMKNSVMIDEITNKITIFATSMQFTIVMKDGQHPALSINEQGIIK